MINRTLLLAFLVAIIFIIFFKGHLNEQEEFTVQSAYNSSMRYMRYNAHPRITQVAVAIINSVRFFIPGL